MDWFTRNEIYFANFMIEKDFRALRLAPQEPRWEGKLGWVHASISDLLFHRVPTLYRPELLLRYNFAMLVLFREVICATFITWLLPSKYAKSQKYTTYILQPSLLASVNNKRPFLQIRFENSLQIWDFSNLPPWRGLWTLHYDIEFTSSVLSALHDVAINRLLASNGRMEIRSSHGVSQMRRLQRRRPRSLSWRGWRGKIHWRASTPNLVPCTYGRIVSFESESSIRYIAIFEARMCFWDFIK